MASLSNGVLSEIFFSLSMIWFHILGKEIGVQKNLIRNGDCLKWKA